MTGLLHYTRPAHSKCWLCRTSQANASIIRLAAQPNQNQAWFPENSLSFFCCPTGHDLLAYMLALYCTSRRSTLGFIWSFEFLGSFFSVSLTVIHSGKKKNTTTKIRILLIQKKVIKAFLLLLCGVFQRGLPTFLISPTCLLS